MLKLDVQNIDLDIKFYKFYSRINRVADQMGAVLCCATHFVLSN